MDRKQDNKKSFGPASLKLTKWFLLQFYRHIKNVQTLSKKPGFQKVIIQTLQNTSQIKAVISYQFLNVLVAHLAKILAYNKVRRDFQLKMTKC